MPLTAFASRFVGAVGACVSDPDRGVVMSVWIWAAVSAVV